MKFERYKTEEYTDGSGTKTIVYCYLDDYIEIITRMHRNGYRIYNSDLITDEPLVQVKLGQDYEVMLYYMDLLTYFKHEQIQAQSKAPQDERGEEV